MKTEIWAHRGASGYAPENTLEAFELAAKMQADGVELDVQLTKDGKLVVIHDEKVDRVTGGTGFVKDFTLEELQKLNANKTHPEYEKTRIPTLREVYELLKPTGLKINVELKTGIFFYPGIEEQCLHLTKELGMEDRIWYSSFNHYTLLRMKQLDPSVKTGILYADGIYDICSYAKQLRADALHPALYNLQFEGVLEQCRLQGLELHVWTVDREQDMEALTKAGIEAIITDYPDRARKVVSRMG